MERRLFWVAALGTICYLAVLVWGMETRLDEVRDLDLNELGDLLAGVFSPLAFWWLVIGYLLQGSELKASREALLLQAHELENSVEQQRELVFVTKEQIQAERLAREEDLERLRREVAPVFHLTRTKIAKYPMQEHTFELQNYGGKATSVKFFGNCGLLSGLPKTLPSLQEGVPVEFTLICPPGEMLVPFTLGVFYIDSLKNMASTGFRFYSEGESENWKLVTQQLEDPEYLESLRDSTV